MLVVRGEVQDRSRLTAGAHVTAEESSLLKNPSGEAGETALQESTCCLGSSIMDLSIDLLGSEAVEEAE